MVAGGVEFFSLKFRCVQGTGRSLTAAVRFLGFLQVLKPFFLKATPKGNRQCCQQKKTDSNQKHKRILPDYPQNPTKIAIMIL
jgi:hypothetical protein